MSDSYVSYILASPSVDKSNALVTISKSDGTKIGDYLIDTGSNAQDYLFNSLCIACASRAQVDIWTNGDTANGYDHITGVALNWPT